jgi:hypothetical protein
VDRQHLGSAEAVDRRRPHGLRDGYHGNRPPRKREPSDPCLTFPRRRTRRAGWSAQERRPCTGCIRHAAAFPFPVETRRARPPVARPGGVAAQPRDSLSRPLMNPDSLSPLTRTVPSAVHLASPDLRRAGRSSRGGFRHRTCTVSHLSRGGLDGLSARRGAIAE